jgi:endonuclease YncB( thermonuclease family)
VGSTIQLITDSAQPNRDRYDRMLRYVDHADVDVSLELLASGAARRYDRHAELARGDAYAVAEDDAHSAGNGMWGNC